MHVPYIRRVPLQGAQDGMERRNDELVERQALTGPVTLTVTITRGSSGAASDTISSLPSPPTTSIAPPQLTTSSPIPAVSSPNAPPQLLTSITPITAVPTSTVLTSDVPFPTSNPTPVSESAPSFSIPPISAIPISGGHNSDSKADDNMPAPSTETISSGGIVGIVLGCLVVLIAAVVFGLRKRSVRNRLKLRGAWTKSKDMRLAGMLKPTPYTYGSRRDEDPIMNRRNQTPPLMGSMGQPVSVVSTINGLPGFPHPLPSAYGIESGGDVNTATSVSGKPVLYSAIVVRSFVTSLPDELSISTGHMLKVLQVFDDGWAECTSMDGETGMVPLECFERRNGEGAERVSIVEESRSARHSRRMSSLRR